MGTEANEDVLLHAKCSEWTPSKVQRKEATRESATALKQNGILTSQKQDYYHPSDTDLQ
jgi:hypothetical protein